MAGKNLESCSPFPPKRLKIDMVKEYSFRTEVRAAITKTVREYARAEVKPEDDSHE